MNRVYRAGAGTQGIGCSALGNVQGEKALPRWGRSTVSRVFFFFLGGVMVLLSAGFLSGQIKLP